MKNPRVRFTVRRMMLAVAVAAVLFWMLERRHRFQRLAEHHRSMSGSLAFAGGTASGPRILVIIGDDGMPISRAAIEWHAVLEKKYEEASSHPWLPVDPDSPKPK